tara:strand:- start:586 stop:1335 length:750 start_codon:yes stop_codon:yes gene_type:complete
MNLFAKKVRNFFRIIKRPFIKKKDFWQDNIPEIDDENKKLIESIGEYSLTPLVRRWTLIKSLHYINQNRIEGDIVECGIWRGGNLFLAKKIQDYYYKDIKRIFYGFDTFEGMPEPSIYDGVKINQVYQSFKKRNEPWTKASLEDVNNSAQNLFSNLDNFSFVKGKVEDTLLKKNNLPNKISILRLDTDFYESTKVELDILYPLLTQKGVLIIDDYGDFPGCRKAVDEYFFKKNVLMIGVDKSCRVIIKN